MDISNKTISNLFPFAKSHRRNEKMLILNYIFREFTVPLNGYIDNEKIKTIGEELCLDQKIVRKHISFLFYNLQNLNRFFKCVEIKWPHNPRYLERKVRIYLHKIHKIAPVFSFTRAKINLTRGHLILRGFNFFPKITTQIAIIIYITDLNDKRWKNKLIQRNIRHLCCSSANAFHRTRNRLDIT